MKEIGGYLELDGFIDNEYYKDFIRLNTARNALVYLCKAKAIKKVYLPYFLCESVSNVCLRENINFEFYHINEKFEPIFDKVLSETEYLYIVNIYGMLSNDKIVRFKKLYKNIILDNTHAFFRNSICDIDTIYSCRKFFGLPDGAYLYTKAQNHIELNEDFSKDRMTHILGRYEGNASLYYNDFKNNDKKFINLPLKSMSKLTQNLLRAIDYKKVLKKRNENFDCLNKNLKNINKIKIPNMEGAYAYPLYLDNGFEIKKELAKQKIYVATLWQNVIENEDSSQLEKDLAKNILPLPLDQRYGEEDMKKIEVSVKCLID